MARFQPIPSISQTEIRIATEQAGQKIPKSWILQERAKTPAICSFKICMFFDTALRAELNPAPLHEVNPPSIKKKRPYTYLSIDVMGPLLSSLGLVMSGPSS